MSDDATENPIPQIAAGDAETQSVDIIAENIERLKELFPELVTEGENGSSVNVDILKQLVGDKTVTDADEKYGLNWHGKRKARQLALTPSTGTLRPCPEESVDWETTKNIFIEGDNLEVLKLLQKSYAGKVKMVYIDPPYNTGKDFVYPDNFRDNIKNYLELTGQVEGGQSISSNKEASGRFHTDWLNMMYPRLRVARELLSEDGIIFISMDDAEIGNLRKACEAVFGMENYTGTILWKKKTNGNNVGSIPPVHDYILCFAKHSNDDSILGFPISKETIAATYKNPDKDHRGPWTTSDLSANHEGPHFPIVNPNTSEIYTPAEGRYWVFNEDEVNRRITDGRIIFGKSGNAAPVQKKFLSEKSSLRVRPESWWDEHGSNSEGMEELASVLGEKKIFDHPKPTTLLKHLANISTYDDDLIIDFFSGSCPTQHALYDLNQTDNQSRRVISVQLPEPTDTKSKAFKAGYKTIAEIGKERIRRAAAKIKEENPDYDGDLGFRVFKLDSSNINAWDTQPENLEDAIQQSEKHLKFGRTEQDILFELLLKLGLDLCTPIEDKKFAGKQVYCIGAGALFVCLTESIKAEEVEELAQGIINWHKGLNPGSDTQLVFRDSAFENDVAKTNMAAIFNQSELKNIRSI